MICPFDPWGIEKYEMEKSSVKIWSYDHELIVSFARNFHNYSTILGFEFQCKTFAVITHEQLWFCERFKIRKKIILQVVSRISVWVLQKRPGVGGGGTQIKYNSVHMHMTKKSSEKSTFFTGRCVTRMAH